jgi:hypothetical protein
MPWEAIFDEDDIPPIFKEDIPINARIVGQSRIVPVRDPDQKLPTPDEIAENKKKWGYE